ncbi:phospholipid-binding protein MlaC [Thermodesulfobacteriota bacterium]
MKKIVILIYSVFLIAPSLSHSAEPIDQLRFAIDEVLVILNDPSLNTESGGDTGHKKIHDIINRIFDFREMSRITLSQNWKRFSEKEKDEFSKVFSEFLTNTYLGKIQTGFGVEKVVYLNQKNLKDTKALVETKILRKTGEVPVDYRMILRNEVWRVYDIRIEGVSLMKNYYVQFREILHKESPAYLINLLKEKIDSEG